MKINWLMQDKHTKSPKANWILIQELEKDICYLYYQLYTHGYLIGDLYYEEIYNLPYWNYIENSFPEAYSTFISEGCLIFLLTMSWEIIEENGYYLSKRLQQVIKILSKISFSSESLNKLKKITLQALTLAQSRVQQEEKIDQLFEQSKWVYENFIKKHFERNS